MLSEKIERLKDGMIMAASGFAAFSLLMQSIHAHPMIDSGARSNTNS